MLFAMAGKYGKIVHSKIKFLFQIFTAMAMSEMREEYDCPRSIDRFCQKGETFRSDVCACVSKERE